MNIAPTGRVHWSFWAIGAVALSWNAMGVMNFFMQLNPGSLAAMSESQRTLIELRPTWATAAFAIAVMAGTVGCLLLLARRRAAWHLFAISLLAMIVHMAPYLGTSGSGHTFGAAEVAMFIAAPLAVAAFLLWYAGRARRLGWLR